MESIENKDLIRYSMQIAMLKQLFDHHLITEIEYNEIKKKLMKGYNIMADFVA